METQTQPTPTPTPPTDRAKRGKKKTTPRVRGPKDPTILEIEQNAKKAKEAYKKSQVSRAILVRIVDTLLNKMTSEHRQELIDCMTRVRPGSPADLNAALQDTKQ